MGIKTLSKK